MSGHDVGPPALGVRVTTWVTQSVAVSLAALLFVVISTSLWWRLTPEQRLDVFVFDQSVTDERFSDHAVLGQLLEYHRVPYDPATDYYGAAPGGLGIHGEWPVARPDLIFLADSYGVYVNDQGEVDDFAGNRVTSALTLSQVEDVASWIDQGTPAYAEFALVTQPTPGPAATLLEETFGFRSTGWTIHQSEDLAELSPSIKSLGAFPWPFEGPGIVLVATPVAGRQAPLSIVVLTEDQLTHSMPTVTGGPPGSGGGTADFDKWITMVEPLAGSTVDAWFELPVNSEGAAVLARVGIPNRFPALIRTDRTLYFAGDGLQDDTPFRLRNLKGGASFTRLVTGDEYRFLYQVLEPSVGWLLAQRERSLDSAIPAQQSVTEPAD